MQTFRLKSGTELAAIGFGTFKITDELTGGRTDEIISEALTSGIRYLDTAAFYDNESRIGEVIRELNIPREDIFLATKVWKTELGYEKTKASIDASLERLGTDYVNLLLVHWPNEFPGDPDWKDKLRGTWRAMEEAYRAGKARDIGLSNFLPHHIMVINEVATVPPVLDQLELHVGHMQQATVDYCREQGIQLQAWSPLGRTRIFAHPVLVEMAARYECKVPELLLRFLLQQGIAVIPKAATREHMLANMNPKEFTISDEDMSILLTMPSAGWAGEHPDFAREAVDFRYQ